MSEFDDVELKAEKIVHYVPASAQFIADHSVSPELDAFLARGLRKLTEAPPPLGGWPR